MTTTKRRRPRVKRYSKEWPASTKRFAKTKHKSVDKSGNGAALRIDSRGTQTMGFAETRRIVVREVLTHKHVTSLLRRIDGARKPQPVWVRRLADNLREWLTCNSVVDTFVVSTLTRNEFNSLSTIQAKRT